MKTSICIFNQEGMHCPDIGQNNQEIINKVCIYIYKVTPETIIFAVQK